MEYNQADQSTNWLVSLVFKKLIQYHPWRYQMKLIHKTAIAAALSSFAMGASAMDQIQDTDLSQVTGQDGVSIAANLNVSIASFVYSTNNGLSTVNSTTTGTSGSIGFNNISFTGVFAMTMDMLSQTNFAGTSTTVAGGAVSSVLGLNMPITTGGTANLTNFYSGGDVVQIAIPALSTSHLLNFSVGSITMGVNGVQAGAPGYSGGLFGGSGQSFGSIAMNSINLGGTSVFIWAH
jgi:hypothetical protein